MTSLSAITTTEVARNRLTATAAFGLIAKPDSTARSEPARASAVHRGASKHGQLEPVRPSGSSDGRSRSFNDALLTEKCSVQVGPDVARYTNCPPRHHRGADVVPENNCAGARRSNNEFLATPPQTAFSKELP
jgi:hypothetical protein